MLFAPRRWRYVLLLLLLVAVFVAERLWTTARLEKRFDERYAELVESGALVPWEKLTFNLAPAGANGWHALAAASKLLREIDSQWRDEDHEHHHDVPLWDPEVFPWTEEATAEAEFYEAKLPPYFVQVDAALEMPVIVPTMRGPLDYPDVTVFMDPSRMSLERAERYPSAAATHIMRLQRLLRRYEPGRSVEALLQMDYWKHGLLRVRDGVEDGRLGGDMLEEWLEWLPTEEERVVRFVRPMQLADRATDAWLLLAVRRGIDPLVDVRRKSEEALEELPVTPETSSIAAALQVPRFDQRWHRRPALLRDCLRGLDLAEARVVRTWTLDELGGVPDDPAYEGTYFANYASNVVEIVAAMRRARIALAAHVEGSAEHSIEQRRGLVEKRLGELPVDPRTGKPFPWTKTGSKHVIGEGDEAWRVP